MKLSEHVNIIRNLITNAFDKQFSRLGLGPSKIMAIEKLQSSQYSKREKFDEIIENLTGETGTYENAREKAVDELTFTLFNRIAAIKVMEAVNLFPPIITKQPEHGDRSFGHKAWLEIRPNMKNEELEGIREYIKSAFNELAESLPLYSKEYPYALLPDAISLNEIIDAFNEVEKDSQVTGKPGVEDNIWESDDILGWLYESYNNSKKAEFKASKKKTEYDKVSLQSQVYTPRWVVQFLVENSLGKLYLEMYPDSEIKKRFKIANAPTEQERDPKPLHEVKLIDPASGSGNFLLYSFDFFYELYIDQIENYDADYDEDEIPKLIIENNLHGIDLDDRAIQLAQLGLYIKARKKKRTVKKLNFKVVSSDFYLPDYEEAKHIFEAGRGLGKEQKEVIEEVWSDLQNAYKFGSLIQLAEKMQVKLRHLISQRTQEQSSLFSDEELGVKPTQVQYDLFTEHDIVKEKKFIIEFFTNLKIAVEKYVDSEENSFLASKTRDAITFLEILSMKYDVAVANPPYTDTKDFGPELKKFIDNNYKTYYKFNTNLYATFIKRCYEFANENGKIAIIHPRTFMFIKTFEDVRKFILEKSHINVFVDYSLSNLFGAIMVDPAFYVLEKNVSKIRNSWFISLDQYTRTPNEKYKKDFCLKALDDYVEEIENIHNYSIPQSKLKIIKSWPFIYWISDEFREKFNLPDMESITDVCQGMSSSNNNRFLRFWWETSYVCRSKEVGDGSKWIRYSKGGPFKKWLGNLWLRINWENNGQEVKKYASKLYGSVTRTIKNQKHYFKEGITYSASGTKGASFRYLPTNTIFDIGGSCIFLKKKNVDNFYILAFMNSKLSFYIAGCLNPTVNVQVGDLKRVPVEMPSPELESKVILFSKKNVSISEKVDSYSIVEEGFSISPLMSFGNSSENRRRVKLFFNLENHLLTQILINESIINGKIFEVYDLKEQDKNMVLEREDKSIGGLPLSKEARKAYLEEQEATKEFPLDNIKEYIESLPSKEFTDEEQEKIENGFPTLFQKNNDLEEFCVKHQINPINVWYWFKQSNVIPKQRMNTLAMEFLADMIREILMENEDGIIPLVVNAGGKVLIKKIEDKFIEKGFTMAQYSGFDSVLGYPINDYINKRFFAALSDHLNLFMYLPKTPFIWHLSSGPKQGFDCYIIIYKWSRDKLMRLKSVYIENRERSLINRQTDLVDNSSAEAQNEKDKIFKQLKEIEAFKVKIDELLSEGYNPVLDDGVGKNIAPLQKKKMITYEVLNKGQLEKYFHADW